MYLRSEPLKIDKKVAKTDPPEPQKVGFGVRVSAIQQNPTDLQKVTKKYLKRLQNESKTGPLGSESPSKDPQKTHKKQGRKKTPRKTTKKTCLSK